MEGKTRDTSFFMLESTDGTTWLYVGTVKASNREQAERRFYAESGDREVTFSAVTEAAWKPRRRKPRVVTSAAFEDFSMPDLSTAPPDRDPVVA